MQATVNALSTSRQIYQQKCLLGSEEIMMRGVKGLMKFVPSISHRKRERKNRHMFVLNSLHPAADPNGVFCRTAAAKQLTTSSKLQSRI